MRKNMSICIKYMYNNFSFSKMLKILNIKNNQKQIIDDLNNS
jgi:hypothetical protein